MSSIEKSTGESVARKGHIGETVFNIDSEIVVRILAVLERIEFHLEKITEEELNRESAEWD